MVSSIPGSGAWEVAFQCDECNFTFPEQRLLDFKECCPRCGDPKSVYFEGNFYDLWYGYKRGVARWRSTAKLFKPRTWGSGVWESQRKRAEAE